MDEGPVPDITSYKSLNKYASLFKTSATGTKGQFLDGDPTYVTNDKNLIANLHLNYKVIYTGSEAALIKDFRAAPGAPHADARVLLLPQWLLSEIHLVHISLPPYTPGCDADPATVTCDYEPYDLDKIENKKFAYSGSPAATLVKNFTWTNADQNEVARDITDNHLTDDQAAKKWLAANRSTWQKWLPAGDASN